MYDEGWNYVQAYSPRLLDSVILKPGEKEHLMQVSGEIPDIACAISSGLGVPYHRGYLLYGPPGTGKTSLVSALGAKFGMSIYVVNLTEFNDRSLKAAMNDVPEDSFILFYGAGRGGRTPTRLPSADFEFPGIPVSLSK